MDLFADKVFDFSRILLDIRMHKVFFFWKSSKRHLGRILVFSVISLSSVAPTPTQNAILHRRLGWRSGKVFQRWQNGTTASAAVSKDSSPFLFVNKNHKCHNYFPVRSLLRNLKGKFFEKRDGAKWGEFWS